ncbi:LacI family DNA-binding transcriptional regulator [Mycobacterium sp. AZCC_0083]|uniref:LacI family DNA-binding transcriptional regulator n=1 Tax=Mycobacterium sp. AZCC_0083 TaxID=2735882 RepID=UPI00180A6452|nr:LacI family DNA-binding transcriptional regulator [Mycobacterium sp. AZCC_0083]MBB5162274.1 LacI family transcriptional regulator [Mycobacterium sp. AZCC_0083]
MGPTIKQVAELAGVSTATVSRALAGATNVSPKLASRIERAVAELGYSGNVIASSLRRNRTDTIGMVVPDISNPFFTALIQHVDHALAQRGWQMLLCDAQSDVDIEAKRLDSLITRRVDGVIISPTNETESAAAVRSASTRVPVVQVDRRASDTDTDWIGIDDDFAQSLIVTHLGELGVRSAAFVSSELTNSSTELRRAGFLKHAGAHGITVRPEWIELGDYSVKWGQEAGRRILGGPSRPDAIVCADDLIALGVLQACRGLNVDVPAELVVVGFDDIPFAALSTPPLTTIAQPLGAIATEGVRLLAQAIEGTPGHQSMRTSLGSKLIVRESTVATRVESGAR